eukprot:UN02806
MRIMSNMNNFQAPQMTRPHSTHHPHPMQQRNGSMPHMNRYNTVPANMHMHNPNIYQRNVSMPLVCPNGNPINNNMNNMQYQHPMSQNMTQHHHPSYGYIPEQHGVIELGQPVISEEWTTSKAGSIARHSKETFKEPLLEDNDDIDYAMDDKSEKVIKKGCCVIL